MMGPKNYTAQKTIDAQTDTNEHILQLEQVQSKSIPVKIPQTLYFDQSP